MAAGRTVICKECRETVSIDHIRYDKNGKDLICIPCFKRGPENTQKSAVSDRDRFMCLRCNYKFTIKKASRIPRKCPYCASPNITLHEIVTAQSVLHEVTIKPETSFLMR